MGFSRKNKDVVPSDHTLALGPSSTVSHAELLHKLDDIGVSQGGRRVALQAARHGVLKLLARENLVILA